MLQCGSCYIQGWKTALTKCATKLFSKATLITEEHELLQSEFILLKSLGCGYHVIQKDLKAVLKKTNGKEKKQSRSLMYMDCILSVCEVT